MGSKKGRGGKVLTVPPDENPSEFSNLSSIDKVSFLEGLKNDDKPLHSTAVEEDLNVFEEGQVDNGIPGRNDDPQTLTTTRGAAVKRKRPETHGEIETEEERRRNETRTVERRNEPVSTANSHKKLVGKKPAKTRGGRKSAVRPVKNKQMKRETKKSKMNSGKSSESSSQEECESGTAQQKRRKVLTSEEESQTPQKAKVYNLSRTRKSSSGSSSADAEKPSISDHRKKRQGHRGETDLDVVLDAFLDFCDKYRESVESKAVKQSIEFFSNNVKEQFLEKISSYNEFRTLKRENTKVGSLIRRKTQRLLDAKNELMSAERQVYLLQKEKAELESRLADLRLGCTFLHDIRELNRQYLEYRDKHRKEKETYGACSSPALQLEQQLKGINNRLGKK